jgi:positive regulator of sigma E activity
MILEPGDQVRLSLQSSHLLRATTLAYGLPLAGIVLFLAAGSWLNDSLGDNQAVLIALAGFVAGWATGRHLLRRDNCLDRLVPRISERVATGSRVSADVA